MCGDLVWIILPCYFGPITNLSLVGARCSCVPHGIKHSAVLAQGGHSRDLHAHVIQHLGIFQSFAVLVSHRAARTHTQYLCLYSTRCACGTQIIVTTTHHAGGYRGGRGTDLSYGTVIFIDVGNSARIFILVYIGVGAGRCVVVVIGICSGAGIFIVKSLLSTVDVVVGVDIGAGRCVVVVIGISRGAGADVVVVESLFATVDIAYRLIPTVDVVVVVGVDIGVGAGRCIDVVVIIRIRAGAVDC